MKSKLIMIAAGLFLLTTLNTAQADYYYFSGVVNATYNSEAAGGDDISGIPPEQWWTPFSIGDELNVSLRINPSQGYALGDGWTRYRVKYLTTEITTRSSGDEWAGPKYEPYENTDFDPLGVISYLDRNGSSFRFWIDSGDYNSYMESRWGWTSDLSFNNNGFVAWGDGFATRQTVTGQIQQVGFVRQVPDSGGTALLLGFAAAGLVCFRARKTNQKLLFGMEQR